ncbi:MAG: glycosyltransferase [Bacteroidales bacterium]|nr:glycosyltransferase [Bacteroidales bacterium]
MLKNFGSGTVVQELALFVIFLFAYAIQLIYYLGVYLKFVMYRKKKEKPHSQPVSVIICARNEAENLNTHLPFVLEQDYDNFEVIVVDDCSTDDTEDVLTLFRNKYPLLKTTTIRRDEKFSNGKKLALILGIKAARHDLLLFTDADCKPESNQWLRMMASNFTTDVSIVLGYGGYFPESGLLNQYIRYDTLFIALQYFSFAICKNPYMGVGRNLAYKKSLFYSGKGFSSHLHLASGDDDLYVNEHATGRNTAVEFSAESHTRSIPKQTIEKWVLQKKRHFTTSRYYKVKHKFLIVVEPFSRLLFYAGFFLLLFSEELLPFIMAAFGIRLLTQLIVIKKTMIRLNEKNLLINSLFFDFISLFVNFGLYLSNRFRPLRHQWK